MSSNRFIRKTLAVTCGAVIGSAALCGTPACEAGFKIPGGLDKIIPKVGRGPINPIDILDFIRKQQEEDRKRILSAKVAEQQVAELVKRAGNDLAVRLPEIEAVKESKRRKILAIGSMQQSDAVKGDLEGALASLQTALINNEAVAGSFSVVDRTTTDAETMMRKVSGAGDDPRKLDFFNDALQQKASTTDKVVYHPDDIYVLSGKLFVRDNADEVKDDPEKRVITYQLTTRVLHARSGEVSLQRDQKQSFVWDKKKKQFVPAA